MKLELHFFEKVEFLDKGELQRILGKFMQKIGKWEILFIT